MSVRVCVFVFINNTMFNLIMLDYCSAVFKAFFFFFKKKIIRKVHVF